MVQDCRKAVFIIISSLSLIIVSYGLEFHIEIKTIGSGLPQGGCELLPAGWFFSFSVHLDDYNDDYNDDDDDGKQQFGLLNFVKGIINSVL